MKRSVGGVEFCMEENNKLKILFAGNGSICLEVFKAVVENFNCVGLLTGADKKGARGNKKITPEIKLIAQGKGIPVIQVEHLRTAERQLVSSLEPDFLVSFSFGRIFGPKFLQLFSKGTLNIHPSKLPNSRGPSPIRAAILSGSNEWAISYQEIGLKMDEGRLFGIFPFSLDGDENVSSLTKKVSYLAVNPCINILHQIEGGKVELKEQEGEISYCSLVNKEDGALDFNNKVSEVHSLIRACYPWPKAYSFFNGNQVFITGVWGKFNSGVSELDTSCYKSGEIVEYKKNQGVGVMCCDGIIYLTGFQFPTKKEIDHKDFMNRFQSGVGQFFCVEK